MASDQTSGPSTPTTNSSPISLTSSLPDTTSVSQTSSIAIISPSPTTTTFTQPRTMAPLTGVINLPIPGTKGAPKKFKGKYSEIQKFISHYEKVCTQRSVTSPKEKVENITQYCSRNVREFMEGLPSYHNGDWTKFVQDLLEYFDADRDDKRYRCSDLESFCKKSRKNKDKMRMSHWKNYSREFIRIAGWLVSHKKISQDEQALFFWKGIPKVFRTQLEARLLAMNPTHDLEKPFEISAVHKLSKSLLQRNRFDHDRLPSDGEESCTSDDEPSTSESDSSSSDSDEENTSC